MAESSKNKEILVWYRNLSFDEKERLKVKILDSPISLRLLHFLQQVPGEAFSTLTAVRYVYAEESTQYSIEILRNRFFKLRKELMEIPIFSTVTPTLQNSELTETESLFYAHRKEVYGNHPDLAIRPLRKLADTCKSNNLFELYPRVVQELIQVSLVQQAPAKAQALQAEWAKAIQWKEAWHQMIQLYYQCFIEDQIGEQPLVFGILKKMQKLSSQYPQLPRFKAFYLFARLKIETIRKTASPALVEKRMKTLESLLTQNPEMPLVYEGPGYAGKALYQINQLRIQWGFLQGDFHKSYQAILENWNLVQQKLVNHTLTQHEYRNRIKLEVITHQYSNALNTASELIKEQKLKGLLDQLPTSYLEMAMIYVFAYPQQIPQDLTRIISFLKQKEKQCQQEKDIRGYGEVLVTRAALLLMARKYTEAFKVIQLPAVERYYAKDIYILMLEFYQLPLTIRNGKAKQNASEQIKLFSNKLYQIESETNDPIYQYLTGFMQRLLPSFLPVASRGIAKKLK
jgi:hypothetical protein